MENNSCIGLIPVQIRTAHHSPDSLHAHFPGRWFYVTLQGILSLHAVLTAIMHARVPSTSCQWTWLLSAPPPLCFSLSSGHSICLCYMCLDYRWEYSTEPGHWPPSFSKQWYKSPLPQSRSMRTQQTAFVLGRGKGQQPKKASLFPFYAEPRNRPIVTLLGNSVLGLFPQLCSDQLGQREHCSSTVDQRKGSCTKH